MQNLRETLILVGLLKQLLPHSPDLRFTIQSLFLQTQQLFKKQ